MKISTLKLVAFSFFIPLLYFTFSRFNKFVGSAAIILALLFAQTSVYGQIGRDGDLVITAANTVVNTYSPYYSR